MEKRVEAMRGPRMRGLAVALVAALMLLAAPGAAGAAIERFAELPAGHAAYAVAINPEGLVYAAESGGVRSASIFVYRQSGALERTIEVEAGSSGQVALRALIFDPDGNLFLADSANGARARGRVLKITPRGRQSVFSSGLTAPNGLALDGEGFLYVSDGVNGEIRWISRDGASALFVEDDRLRPHSSRGYGASGLAFSPQGDALYVANTADDRIIKVSIGAEGAAGRVSTLADGSSLRNGRGSSVLDGPEGLAVDARGNLLVAASRANQVEILSPEGRSLGRLPTEGGALHSPTGIALGARNGYVANLAAEYGISFLSRFPVGDLPDR